MTITLYKLFLALTISIYASPRAENHLSPIRYVAASAPMTEPDYDHSCYTKLVNNCHLRVANLAKMCEDAGGMKIVMIDSSTYYWYEMNQANCGTGVRVWCSLPIYD